MTINAAMPAVAPNQSYTGTAAATDIASSTAGDFSGTLGSMMNARGTVNAQTTATGESEMAMALQQGVENGEAVMTAEQTVLMNQLHKELMMKNAGYAQGELVAMLLNGANAELTQLMSFDGEIQEDSAMLTEGIEGQQELPAMQTEAMDYIPEAPEETVTTDGMTEASEGMTKMPEAADKAEATLPETFAEALDMADDTKKADIRIDENEAEYQSDAVSEGAIPESRSAMTENLTDSKETEFYAVNKAQETALQTEIPDVVQLHGEAETTEAVQSAEAHEATDSEAETVQPMQTADKVMMTMTEGTATAQSTEAKATQTVNAEGVQLVKAEDVQTAKPEGTQTEIPEAMQTVKTEVMQNVKPEEVQKAQAEDIWTARTEDITADGDTAEQTPDTAEEMTDFETTFARAGRRISEKSEEALQLAKSISGTNSDSDLETEQKVTVKQELTDGGITESAVKPEFIAKEDVKAEAPVKLTVNEAYQIINEKAAATTGKQTFTVELTPETLGKITVKMVSENGKLSVEILTETEAAKQLFEARANELANNLRQNNVEIGSYRVETENEQLFNESFDGSSKNPYAERQQSETSEDEDEFEQLISEMMGM